MASWLLAGAGMMLAALLLGKHPDPLLLVLASQAAVALPVLLLLLALRPPALGLGPAAPRAWLGGVALGPLAFVCSLTINGVVILFAGLPPKDLPIIDIIDGLHQRIGLGGLVLCAAVLPGIVEEALFRGVILTGLRRHLSPAAAVLITALLFAALHLDPWRFLPQLTLGLLLGWWTLRSGSCWPAAVAHAVHNAIVLVVSRMVPH